MSPAFYSVSLLELKKKMESSVISDIAAHEDEIDSIDNQIATLQCLATDLENQPELSQEIAACIDAALNKTCVLEAFFETQEGVNKHRVALEEISAGLIAAIAAGFAALVALVVKLIGWLRSGSGNGGISRAPESAEQLKAVQEVLGDKELEIAVDDAVRMAEESKKHPAALEEFRHPQGITAEDVFDRFKQSLTEPEIDFLTSGQRYKVIKETVDDFSKGSYSKFVKNLGEDITAWYEEGLKQAPFIGRSEDVVQKFIYKEQRKVADIKAKYGPRMGDIEEMERRVQLYPPKGNYEHLVYFRSKPSALFPHLEHLWKSIRFDQMSEEDKDLISSLEQIKHKFEEAERHLRGKSEAREKPWPAEQEVIRLSHQVHREVVKHITMLVKVGLFIKHSGQTAFEATVKSFSYIQRLLNAISKMPGIDHNRLHRCIDTIHRKRNELINIVGM